MSRTSDLVKAMVNIRDQDRVECGRYLFELLGYNDSAFITELQLDELLFKVVRNRLGASIYADMLLMAFGLLPGYEYDSYSLGERRRKFLRNSNWLKVNRKSKITEFDSASKEDQDSAEKSLPNVEKYWMGKIADEFIKHVKLKNENGEEIKGALEKYIKLLDDKMEKVCDASGKIIDYIPKVPPSSLHDDENDVPDEVSTNHEETEQDILEAAPPADEPNTGLPPESGPATINDQQDSYSKGGQQSAIPDPPPTPRGFRIHIGRISIGPLININNKSRVNSKLTWIKVPVFCVLLVFVAFFLWKLPPFTPPTDEMPPVKEIFVTDAEISLKPNAIFVLSTAILPPEAQNTPLSFVSSDPKVVTVSRDGRLQVPESHEAGGTQVADITIQAENGVTKIKTVTVDFSADSYDALTVDIDDFVPEFTVEQKIRLAGTSGWNYNVEAEVGDFVEIQIQFKNLSDTAAKDVMVRDALPVNMVYIPGSTKLYNSVHPDGAIVDQDTIAATTGINIGSYTKDANAYIRFMARIVDATLADGSDTLVSWSQACVNGVTLQDYATAVLQKTA